MANERFKNIHSVSDIIDTMIKGLNREWVRINMDTFGKEVNGICFGCAATNTLCELMQEPFDISTIDCREARIKKINYSMKYEELGEFENAIDFLRQGKIKLFLLKLKRIAYLFSFKLPEELPPINLHILNDHNYKELLHEYEKYRDFLKANGL